ACPRVGNPRSRARPRRRVRQACAAVPTRAMARVRAPDGGCAESGTRATVPGRRTSVAPGRTATGSASPRLVCHRLQAAQIAHESVEVLGGDVLVGGEVHRRLQLGAVAADALGDGPLDPGVAPLAEAGLRVGGDVGGDADAPRPLEMLAPGAGAGHVEAFRAPGRVTLEAV